MKYLVGCIASILLGRVCLSSVGWLSRKIRRGFAALAICMSILIKLSEQIMKHENHGSFARFLKLIPIFCLVIFGACATRNKTVTISTPFDANQAAKQLSSGSNHISGSGLLKQINGRQVTCAGRAVTLIPATQLAQEWVRQIVHSPEGGSRFSDEEGIIFNGPEMDKFYSNQKATYCDALGFFKFRNIADGTFYLFTRINWESERGVEGGIIIRKITLAGGQTEEIVLSQ